MVVINKNDLDAFKNFLDAKGIEWRESSHQHQVIMVRANPPEWYSLFTSGKKPDDYVCDTRLGPLVQEFWATKDDAVLVSARSLADLVHKILVQDHILLEARPWAYVSIPGLGGSMQEMRTAAVNIKNRYGV